MDSLFFFGGVALLGVLGIPLLILAVLVVVAGRSGEPDPNGWRPYTNYLAGVTFIALFVTLFAAFAVVGSLLTIPVNTEDESSLGSVRASDVFDVSGSDQSPSFVEDFAVTDPDDAAVRNAVQAALTAIAAAGVFWFHQRRLDALTHEVDFDGSAPWRVHQAYQYAVCFFAVLMVLFATAAAAYGVFRALAPGVAGDEKAGAGLAQLASAGLLALASWAIFDRFWRGVRREAAPAVPLVPPPPTGG